MTKKKKDKRTKNDLQNNPQKTSDQAKQTLLNIKGTYRDAEWILCTNKDSEKKLKKSDFSNIFQFKK
jgi:hypothetical protein